jgi:hypothetical protein
MSSSQIPQGVFGGAAPVLGVVELAIIAAHPGADLCFAAIAQIAPGVALIVSGTALAGSCGRLAARLEPSAGVGDMMTGTTADEVLGTAVVIPGVLSLVHVEPAVLVPRSLVGLGISLNRAASARIASLETESAADRPMLRLVGQESVFATASVRAIDGIASAVLGIIALAAATSEGRARRETDGTSLHRIVRRFMARRSWRNGPRQAGHSHSSVQAPCRTH